MSDPIELNRECAAIEIPSGTPRMLPSGTRVSISQFLGTGYTVITDIGFMCRIDAKDAEALGLTPPPAETKSTSETTFNEKMAWDQLRTVYDPEIPVNIVDLGLIYSCQITQFDQGGKKIEVKMSMTAPGCGMANVLKADVESKLARLPEIKEVHVEVVFEPAWHPGLMSEAAKLQLGFDLDYGSSPAMGIGR